MNKFAENSQVEIGSGSSNNFEYDSQQDGSANDLQLFQATDCEIDEIDAFIK